jgi:hypothetical protein
MGSIVSTVFGCLLVGFILLVLFLQRRAGWRRLVELYGALKPPAGRVLLRQTIKIGAVDYEGCVTVWIAAEGMYLRIWRKIVLVPWSEFKYVGQVTFYCQRASELTVGDPALTTIIVKNELFEMIRERVSNETS